MADKTPQGELLWDITREGHKAICRAIDPEEDFDVTVVDVVPVYDDPDADLMIVFRQCEKVGAWWITNCLPESKFNKLWTFTGVVEE